MRLVTLGPSLMVVFSSFTTGAIRGRDVMLQGCNSQRKGGRGPQMDTFFPLPGACPGTCLGGWGGWRLLKILRKEAKERKEGKMESVLILVHAFF